MKLFIILTLIVFVAITLMAISGKKSIKEHKENADCLTQENFFLIKNSKFVDGLSKYTIHRENNQLRFTPKGKRYTLFYLKLEDNETPNVILVGLDGYGIRDKEFLKYICTLLKEVRRAQEINSTK